MSWATPGTVQIICNMFRLKPAEEVFPLAQDRRVGIIARVPLASGLLSGKMTREGHFAPDDHRLINRHGEQFDRGETFSGVDFETGLQAAEEFKRLVPPGATLAQRALRWITMFDAVSCAIPGRSITLVSCGVRTTTWHGTCLRRHRACMPQGAGITLAMTPALWPHTLLQTDARRRGTWRGQRIRPRDCHGSNKQQGSHPPIL